MAVVFEGEQQEKMIQILKDRFEANMERHPQLDFAAVAKKLNGNPEKLAIIALMESSGGEPDVIDYDSTTNQYLFVDCVKESPSPRRNLCYDKQARITRKKFPPESSAQEMAEQMGVELLDPADYALLQSRGRYDLKTSSWLATPQRVRELGGAIFGDCRYDTVFNYHNGADSYYGSRGFRAKIKV